MPTYEYQREDGSTFEVVQSIKDDALEVCPETGQKVKRIITGSPKVTFKGQDWDIHRNHRRYTLGEDGDAKDRRAAERAKRRGRYVVTSEELRQRDKGNEERKESNSVQGSDPSGGPQVEQPTNAGDSD